MTDDAGSISDVEVSAKLRRQAVVIAPTDFSPASLVAAKFALRVAQQCQGRLILVHAVYLNLTPYGPANPEWLKAGLSREAMEQAEPIMISAQEAGVSAICVVEEGEPAATIAKVAEKWDADLIVLSGREPGFFSRWFGRSTADAVIDGAKCPVIILQCKKTTADGRKNLTDKVSSLTR